MLKRLSNYSLTKIAVICAISLLTSLSFSYSAERIFDQAGILEPKHTLVLNRMIGEWEEKTKHQMAIVTVKSLNGQEIEDYAVKKFEELGIGRSGENDGLMLLVAPNERRLRIEVGYGLEQYLNDGLVGTIRDNYIIPHFKNNDFATGILQGTYALLVKQAEMEGIELPQLGAGELPASPTTKVATTNENMVGAVIFIIIILILLKSKTGRSVLMWSLLASTMGGGSHRSNNFGSFGGGFGGFGGGLSGGGGASGRW